MYVLPTNSVSAEIFGSPQLPTWMLPEPSEAMPDVLRCAYASKRCDNPRTIKKSGGLHRFCAFHRERANRTQWRVDQRRRASKQQSCTTNASKPTRRRSGSPRCLTDLKADHAEAAAGHEVWGEEENFGALVEYYKVWTTREAQLNEQDVEILSVLLFDEDALSAPRHSTMLHDAATIVS